MHLEDVRAMQTFKLRRQLSYLAQRSPFYSRKLAEEGFDPESVRSIDDLAGAPFTEKQELRDTQVAVPPLGEHAAVEMVDIIRVHSSSGTTGRPSYVGITHADRERWTEVISRVYW